MIFDLSKVLMELKLFLAMFIMLYQMKYLLVRLLDLVHFECRSVLPKMVGVQWLLGDRKDFLEFALMWELNLNNLME